MSAGDLRAGRCYFPEDELRDAGLALADLLNAPAAFLPIYQRWIAEHALVWMRAWNIPYCD